MTVFAKQYLLLVSGLQTFWIMYFGIGLGEFGVNLGSVWGEFRVNLGVSLGEFEMSLGSV